MRFIQHPFFGLTKIKIRARLYIRIFQFQSCLPPSPPKNRIRTTKRRGKSTRLSLSSLCRPPYVPPYLVTSDKCVCVYVLFLFTRRRKGNPIKGKEGWFRPREIEMEGWGGWWGGRREGNARGKRRGRFLVGTASIFKLARPYMQEWGWQGAEGAGGGKEGV